MKRLFVLIIIQLFVENIFAQKLLTIGILSEQKTEESDQLLQKFKNDVIGVLGSGYSVSFKEVLYSDYSIEKAKFNYDNLIKNNSDLIISFGPTNSVMFLNKVKEYSKPTIVVGFINKDLSKVTNEYIEKSNIDNLTFYITPYSYSEDIDAFRQIYKFKKLGIIIDEELLNILPIEKLFKDYFSEKEYGYELIKLTKSNSSISLKDSIDAVYLVSSINWSQEQLKSNIKYISDKKIPSISAYGVKDVELGILATNQPNINLEQIFRRVALGIEAIANGTNPKDLKSEINYDNQLTLNLSVAEALNIPIKNSAISAYNLIDNGIQNTSETFSLVEIMNEVVEGNLSLEAQRKSVEINEQDVRLSKSNYNPEIAVGGTGTYLDPKVAEASFGQNTEYSVAGKVQLTQTIYSADASADIQIQKASYSAKKEDYNTEELDAILNSGIAYFNSLILNTNKIIQLQNLQLTKQNLLYAERNELNGSIGKSDVLRLKSQLAQNTQSLIEARNNLNQSYYLINQLINQPINTEVALRDTIISVSFDDNNSYDELIKLLDDPLKRFVLTNFLIDEAKNNSPEIKSIYFNTIATEKNYQLNKTGRFLPTVALQGQYNYNFVREGAGSEPNPNLTIPTDNYNVALNVSIPIFKQNTNNINQQKALLQTSQLNTQKQNFELNIEKQVSDLILNLVNEITNIEISKYNIEVANENLEMAQSEYASGIISVIQLIDAQNNFLQAQLSNSTAKYNYYIASLKLQRAIGYFFLMNSEDANAQFVQRAEDYLTSNN